MNLRLLSPLAVLVISGCSGTAENEQADRRDPTEAVATSLPVVIESSTSSVSTTTTVTVGEANGSASGRDLPIEFGPGHIDRSRPPDQASTQSRRPVVPDEFSVRWTADLPLRFGGSTLYFEDAYIQTGSLPSGEFVVEAHSTIDGSPLWTRALEDARITESVVADGVLVLGLTTPPDTTGIIGVDAATGETRWERDGLVARLDRFGNLVADTPPGISPIDASTGELRDSFTDFGFSPSGRLVKVSETAVQLLDYETLDAIGSPIELGDDNAGAWSVTLNDRFIATAIGREVRVYDREMRPLGTIPISAEVSSVAWVSPTSSVIRATDTLSTRAVNVESGEPVWTRETFIQPLGRFGDSYLGRVGDELLDLETGETRCLFPTDSLPSPTQQGFLGRDSFYDDQCRLVWKLDIPDEAGVGALVDGVLTIGEPIDDGWRITLLS